MLTRIPYLWEFMAPYIPYLASALLLMVLGAGAAIVYLVGEIRRLERRLRRLAGTGEIEDLKLVMDKFQDLKAVTERVNRLEEKTKDILESLESTLCRVGLVRFNAFPDTGSELSFALAVLSKEGDGFVLTSLYSREETRVFLKPVKKGKPLFRLSEEEEKALNIALGYIAT